MTATLAVRFTTIAGMGRSVDMVSLQGTGNTSSIRVGRRRRNCPDAGAGGGEGYELLDKGLLLASGSAIG